MKKIRNLFILFLSLVMAFGSFACKKKEPDVPTPPASDPVSFLDYAIIRPEKISNALLDEISELYIRLLEISGQNNVFATDYLGKNETADPEAKEILIGHTNRSETAEVLAKLGADEYAVAVIGNKIVITGIADSLTPIALEWFVSHYLGSESDGSIAGDLFYKASADIAVLVDRGEPIYSIVRPESGNDGMVNLCYQVYDAIEKTSGVALPIKTDRLNTGASHDDSACEILFGDVSYSQVKKLKSNVAPDAYNIEFVGNKIVIYAWSAEGLEQATKAFANLLTYACYTDADGKTTVCIAKEPIKGKNSSLNFYTDVPHDINGRRYDNVYNAYDGAMMLHWTDATEDMLVAYANGMEKQGYSQYQAFDSNSLRSVTYVKEKVSVHIYLLKRTAELRVVAQDNAVLPVNPYEYQELCSPAVTQIGIYSDAEIYTGMSYLIRLADGTFVVIDGGHNREDNAKMLYDTMVEQKPDGMDDIVITAWILTHAHGDHRGVLMNFMEKYNDKVTVKMLIANDISDFVYSTNDFGKRAWAYSDVNGKFGGCRYMKAHTGQQFFFPGATFTILYTHEDVYPGTMKLYNDAACIFFDTVIEDTRFMWLADMEKASADRFKAMYMSDMKCDVMQIPHHGLGGGSYDVFRLCAPSVALWPGGQHCVDAKKSLAQNKYLIDTIGWENIHIHKDGSYTIWFDHLPDIASQVSNLVGSDETDGIYTENY